FNEMLLGSNGPLDAASNADQNWNSFDTYDVLLRPGINTLTVRAVNYHSPGATEDPEQNPGGLVFKLTGQASLQKTLPSGSKAEVLGIHFEIDKWNIKSDSGPVLSESAAALAQEPTLRVEISGHTDGTGDAGHNRLLSRQRANAVVAGLARSYGVSAKRLTAA